MKQPEFTEGPWEISPPFVDEYDIVKYTIGPAGVGGAQFVEEMICIVESPNQPTEANARLIAAAPELFECLTLVVEFIEEGVDIIYRGDGYIAKETALENAISVLHMVRGEVTPEENPEVSDQWLRPIEKAPSFDEKVIIKLNGVVQHETYELSSNDDGRFIWYREGLDEYPFVNVEKDQWMPLPK